MTLLDFAFPPSLEVAYDKVQVGQVETVNLERIDPVIYTLRPLSI